MKHAGLHCESEQTFMLNSYNFAATRCWLYLIILLHVFVSTRFIVARSSICTYAFFCIHASVLSRCAPRCEEVLTVNATRMPASHMWAVSTVLLAIIAMTYAQDSPCTKRMSFALNVVVKRYIIFITIINVHCLYLSL